MNTFMTRMSFKVLALTSVLGMITVAMPSQAKDPDLYFYPKKSWVLSSAESPVGNTCQITNQFNNGFILQVNGSENWVDSIQVDFRQASFEVGQSYSAMLSVPGVKKKSVQAQAISASVLKLDVAAHKDLYKAMRGSSVFDFTIDDNEFRFYMVGFANSALEFERCMSGAKEMRKKETLEAARQQDVEEQEKTGIKVTRADLGADSADPVVNETIDFETAERTNQAHGEIKEVLPPVPVADIQVENTEPVEPAVLSKPEIQPRKRLSAMLAEQISANPEIAAIDPEAPNPGGIKSSGDEVEKAVAQQDIASPGEPQMLPLPTPTLAKEELKTVPVEEAAAVPPLPEKAKAHMEAASASALAAPDVEPPSVKDLEAPEELSPVTQSYKSDIKVNKNVQKVEADLTDMGAPSPYSGARSEESYRELRQQVLELEREKEGLKQELMMSLEESRQEDVQITSENWNLERATMRYQEAERQTKRLAQQIQQERAQCAVEKQELEAMLFDPRVTDEQQLAKLADLNKQLERARQDMEEQRLRYEERIKILETYAAQQ